MTTPSESTYRPDIDGLRAVAILLVAIFHFRLLPIGEAGFIGVDIFFVISGYLITGILMRDLAAGRMSLGRFYLARIRRLMPALVITLALYLAVAAFFFLPDQFEELAVEALLTQAYGINFYFWQSINYFGLRADQVPLLHMWSLAVEEQFYLFYPIFLAFVFRVGRKFVLPVLVGITLLSFALGWWATGWKPEASFYLLPTRAWELGAGAVFALLRSPLKTGGNAAAVMGLIGAGIIIVALLIYGPLTAFPGWFAALPVLGAVLLILAGPATPTGAILSLRPMLWIGWISYPLYLVHWPVIQIMHAALPDVTLWHRWVGFGVSIGLAWAIWRFVEQPVRRGVFLQRKGVLLGWFGAATAVLSSVALAGFVTQGFPSRFSPAVQQVLTYSDDMPIPFFDCEFKTPNTTPCPLGVATGDVTVAVIGDSHAQALAGALDRWLAGQGVRGALWFHHGCRPMDGTGDATCRDFMQRSHAAIAQSTGITDVLLISAWRHDPGIYDGAYLTDNAADAAFTQAIAGTVTGLIEQGFRVVLVDPMFAAKGHVPKRLARNIAFGRDLPVDQDPQEHAALFAHVHAVFTTAALEPHVTRVSLIDDLCKSGVCYATREGTPVFRDGNHIRFGMSDYFAERFDEMLPNFTGETE